MYFLSVSLWDFQQKRCYQCDLLVAPPRVAPSVECQAVSWPCSTLLCHLSKQWAHFLAPEGQTTTTGEHLLLKRLKEHTRNHWQKAGPLGAKSAMCALHGGPAALSLSPPASPTAALPLLHPSTWPPFSSLPAPHSCQEHWLWGQDLGNEREPHLQSSAPSFNPGPGLSTTNAFCSAQPRSVSLLKHKWSPWTSPFLTAKVQQKKGKSRVNFTVSRNANLERYQKTGPRLWTETRKSHQRMGERARGCSCYLARTHQIFRNTSPENHLHTSLWDLGHSEQHCSPGHQQTSSQELNWVTTAYNAQV